MMQLDPGASGDIHRHRTALKRSVLSRPVRLAVSDGLLSAGSNFLDYGCGFGNDVELLQPLGVNALGWDPVHRPSHSISESDVVNLGYVINVIENATERSEALQRAWGFAKRLLIVSARLVAELKGDSITPYADGCITKTQTFQKYYEQAELRQWIEDTLGVQAVAAAPGVFYVFRDFDWKETFLASKSRRRASVDKISTTVAQFHSHRDLLKPLIEFLELRGRLPDGEETLAFATIVDEFGSLKKAYRLIVRVTGTDQWNVAREEGTQDLMVYLALSRFGGRPRRRHLPDVLDADVRAFFGTYRKACEASDRLLFQAGNPEAVDEAIRASPVGKKTQSALYVHRRALPNLPALLRVREGCARSLVGEVEGANIIKLHRIIPQVSYLGYPDFDSNPHPALAGSLLVHLQSFRVSYRDYSTSENPPILHRKEEFIMRDDPNYPAFAALTAQEVGLGLFADPQSIGTAQGWYQTLKSLGVVIVGTDVRREASSCSPDECRGSGD